MRADRVPPHERRGFVTAGAGPVLVRFGLPALFELKRQMRDVPDPLARPSTQLDDSLVQVVRDVQLAGFERPVLGEGESQVSGHLHRSQPHALTVPRKVLHEDGKHGSGHLHVATWSSHQATCNSPAMVGAQVRSAADSVGFDMWWALGVVIFLFIMGLFLLFRR